MSESSLIPLVQIRMGIISLRGGGGESETLASLFASRTLAEKLKLVRVIDNFLDEQQQHQSIFKMNCAAFAY